MAVNANMMSFLNTARKAVFGRTTRFTPSLFTMGLGYVGFNAALRGTSKVVQQGGANIGLYRGLYTDKGDNIISSGRRGIDAKTGGTSGLVQGLHNSRRKY